jgi:hypothetical protein
MVPSVSRPKRAIAAADVLHGHSREIARACTQALAGDVIVAGVAGDLSFTPPVRSTLSDLRSLVLDQNPGGWSLVFSAGDSVLDVEDRCLTMRLQAYRRWKASWQLRRDRGYRCEDHTE